MKERIAIKKYGMRQSHFFLSIGSANSESIAKPSLIIIIGRKKIKKIKA